MRLINKNVISPYLAYWINILGDKRPKSKTDKEQNEPEITKSFMNVKTVKAIHNYIHYYGYKGVARLMRRFGYFSVYDPAVNYVKPQEEEETGDQ